MAGNALLAGLDTALAQERRRLQVNTAALREVPGLIERAVQQEAPREVLRVARELSSGPYSRRQLRAMGHPYAKRAPSPPLPPYIINVQTGQFRNAWRCEAKRQGDRVTLELTNTAPYADYLFRGTRLMIARPILAEIKRRVEPSLTQKVADVVIAALNRT